MFRLLPSILLLGLMVGVGVALSLRGTLSAGIPSRQPASAAKPWMADCLVGVGPKRREEIARYLHDGHWEQVPLRARARAIQVFDGVPGSWSLGRH